jgi:hypothetical protein
MAERQPIPIPEPQRAPHEGGNGALGLPRTVHESAKPPPPESQAYPTLRQNSALNRAVERTRDLYERNGWVFLPLGEVGKGSPGIPTLQGEQQPHSGGINKPEFHPPKELSLPFEPTLPSQEHHRRNLPAADQEILARLQKASESWGKLPHPLAQEFKDAMIKEVVHEVWTELYPKLKRQADQRDEQLDDDIMEALEDPIQRKKLLEDD